MYLTQHFFFAVVIYVVKIISVNYYLVISGIIGKISPNIRIYSRFFWLVE